MPQLALAPLLSVTGLALARFGAVNTPARASRFFARLGYELAPAAFGPALTQLSTQASSLSVELEALAVAGDDASANAALAQLMVRLGQTLDAMGQLASELQTNVGGAVPHLDALTRRLTDHLLLAHLDMQLPALHAGFQVLGLVEQKPAPEAGMPSRTIHWERLGRLLNEPRQLFNDVYGWETELDIEALLSRLEALMRRVGLPGGFYPQSQAAAAALGTLPDVQELRVPIFELGVTPATRAQFGITLSPVGAQAVGKPGLALFPFLTGASQFGFEVCERGELTFEATADVRSVGIVVRPPFDAQGLLGLTGPFRAAIRVREKPEQAQELVLAGSAGGSRLSLRGLGLRWVAQGTREQLDLGVQAEVDALRLVISAGEGDGFIQKLLSTVQVDAQTAIAFGMWLRSGFSFSAGGRLAIDVGLHLDAGPVHLTALRLAVAPSADALALDTGVTLSFELGPLQALVENIGLRTKVSFTPGNLGPAQLNVQFLPPNGVGLTLDTGGFKGGGFLRFDEVRGEYAGALELDFHGLLSVKAVGIINTRMPDGQPGYSLLILISAEFTPIQLSFGFTLNGVGGLIGLNRTIVINALADGIRTNAIKSVLFPENVVANIERIVSDLKQFFPPLDGHFVVGPMAKLGWGTPPIITVELGLLLDLPEPMFAIVGVLKAALPAQDAPILRLQVNFVGVLDFDHGYLFFRADLFDSRLLLYSITGSMALLVSWGEQQTFALSVGGFHPAFKDVPNVPALPDGFRNMARIGLSLLSDDNPRLKVESYFAVTSNTVQFGARVELYAAACGFNVYGFLGYDVLFYFDPFHFVADLSGGIALREGTSVLASVSIAAQLSGPTPWDARGEATLSLLFIDIDVSFHVSWGDPAPAVDKKTEDLMLLLQKELADTRNWRAELPANSHLHVTLRKIDAVAAGDLLVVHPAGVLRFSQRSLPLESYLIERFGNKKPLNVNQFKLSDVRANAAAIAADFQSVREEFAPAQYSELSDSDKLSRDSFAALPSGFTLPPTANLVTPLPVTRGVDYELSYLHRKERRLEFRGLVKFALRAYDRLVKGSAVRRSALSLQQTRLSLNAPPQIVLPREAFAIANVDDLKSHLTQEGVPIVFGTQEEANQKQRALVRDNPALAGQIQVVSQLELNS